MKSYLLTWFNSLGEAYAAADMASRAGARILELFPFTSKGQLFLELPSSFEVKPFLNSLPAPPIQSAHLAELSDDVMKAYLSLTNPPVQEDLLIFESDFLGDTLLAAQRADKLGLSLLDIRFMRDSTGHSYLMATGKASLCEGAAAALEAVNGKITHIKNPGEGLRDFFPTA